MPVLVSRAEDDEMRTLRVRAPRVVSVAATIGVAAVFAGACLEEGSSDERPALDADARGGSAPCPVESAPRSRPEVRAVAFAYGEGPAFVGLGTSDGVVRYTVDTRSHDGWHYYKTLWAIAPTYAGKVVITGTQIGGTTELRFNPGARFPGQKELQLRFPQDDSGKWRYGPSDTLIRAPGCYALHVEGAGFKETIAFEARD
jgi:hypothetical protein